MNQEKFEETKMPFRIPWMKTNENKAIIPNPLTRSSVPSAFGFPQKPSTMPHSMDVHDLSIAPECRTIVKII
jgi:hypothetical protein